MDNFIKICTFMRALFEEEEIAIRAAEIGQAILDARSLPCSLYILPPIPCNSCDSTTR